MKNKLWNGFTGAVVALFFFASFHVAWSASPDEIIQKFEWLPNDSWTYLRPNGTKYTKVVVSVRPNLIEAAELLKNGRYAAQRRTYTPDLNKTSVQGYSNPAWPVWDFPIWPGKKWGSTFSVPHLDKPGVVVEYTVSSTAVGWENVTVPMGTIRAMKILTHFKFLSSNGATDSGKEEMWISPEVAGTVKYHYIEFYRRNEYGYLLESFTRAPRPSETQQIVQTPPSSTALEANVDAQ